MIRTLYPSPGPVDFGLLVTELRSVDPTVISSNDVAGQVAVYAPGVVDEQALGAVVAAHAGPPAPAPDVVPGPLPVSQLIGPPAPGPAPAPMPAGPALPAEMGTG